jgi:hypothetical protein
LKTQLHDAVECYFEGSSDRPSVIRLH